MNKHNSDRCSGKRSRVFLDSAAAIFSLARGTELTAGSGALWSGLLLFYWFIIACYISVKCLTNTMFIFTQKLLNRDVLQRILHCWASEWRESDDSRLWRHKLYLVTTQIQRGRLYDSATWPPSLDQPSSDHLQRGQPFCQRHCLFVNLCCCCYCCCCNPIICADLRGTATAPLIPASPPPATPKTHSASWPRPQRSTGSDGRSLVGYHPKETQHCCRVTWGGVYGCLFWFNKRRASPAMCPILTTVLGKLRSQNSWALTPTPESRFPLRPSACNVEGFDQNCLRQGRRQEHWNWGHHDPEMAWRATVRKLVFYAQSTSAVISWREGHGYRNRVIFFFFFVCIDRRGW